jgi:hypothetical protein
MPELIDFDRDDAAQELLGHSGITEAYENLISRVALDILRESVPDCEIESVRYVCSTGKHSGFRVGGMPVEEGSSKIILQDMTMPFDLEIMTRSGDSRHLLKATFTIECRKMDDEPQNEYLLEVHEQLDA